jgi:hypothetical protein
VITLADVLELIHSSRQRFRTARARGHTDDDSAWRLWWEGDDRFRFERGRAGRGSIGVRAGSVWWALDADGRAYTNEGNPEGGLGMQPEFALLHTRSLLASAILEEVGEAQVARRRAAILRATPRPGAEHWRWWGFWDSTEPIEIPIDLERGVALGGSRFRVEEIAFDEHFAPEVFSRPYPDTHQPVERGLRARQMALEEARREAPFPLVLPKLLPEAARLLRCLVEPADPPQWVGLWWAIDPGHRHTLGLRQGPAVEREAERFRGEEIVEQDMRLLIEELGPGAHRAHTVFVCAGGTWFEIHSDLPREITLAVARSLKEPA